MIAPRFIILALAILLWLPDVFAHAASEDVAALRVCSDPNNLPFSNRAQEGFENRLAELLAEKMDVPLEYYWQAQRRGFLRKTLNAGKCDVVMGMPSGTQMLLTSRPYYRSQYVFVTRKNDDLTIASLDDPVLRDVSVGVHLIGDDYRNTPPAHGLAQRGIIENVVGYMIYGDYSKPNPPARMIEAVANGDIDVAIAWGPLAGYFATRSETPLAISPVQPMMDRYGLPFFYSISLAVRKNDHALKEKLDEILYRERDAVQSILAEYDIPGLDGRSTARRASSP